MGTLASIGSYKGVAEVFGIRFSGLLAWMAWRFLYIGMLPGFSTRLRVALNWAFDFVMPRSIVQIANQGESGTIVRRYAEGDVISGPGQFVDGLYSVLEGRLESRVPQGDGQEDFVRIIGPGEHWGEVLATEGTRTQGTLTALEDARVLILRSGVFRSLREAFPTLDDYFSAISVRRSIRRHRGGQSSRTTWTSRYCARPGRHPVAPKQLPSSFDIAAGHPGYGHRRR